MPFHGSCIRNRAVKEPAGRILSFMSFTTKAEKMPVSSDIFFIVSVPRRSVREPVPVALPVANRTSGFFIVNRSQGSGLLCKLTRGKKMVATFRFLSYSITEERIRAASGSGSAEIIHTEESGMTDFMRELDDRELDWITGGTESVVFPYTVKFGDCLSVIATKFRTTVQVLMQLNPQLKNPNDLPVGTVIRIPLT